MQMYETSERSQSVPGKKVAGKRYLHVSALQSIDSDTASAVRTAASIAAVRAEQDFNVVRIDESGFTCALLSYPRFFDDPFPRLEKSWKVDLGVNKFSFRTYSGSLNPPILHRKELLLSAEDPRRERCEALTLVAEGLGLFEDPSRIGFLQPWEELIRKRGYRLQGSEFVPIGNDDSEGGATLVDTTIREQVDRHLTALTRYGFSAPIQALARYGFLGQGANLFDYGCGRGDDLRGLKENGIEVAGWDPHYAPEQPKLEADHVNLGFVINVIEDFGERVDALKSAYALTRKVLAVSAMLSVTSRNTFQKYYTQSDLAAFIADVLDEEPIPVSPGVFFVFRDKDAEQRFLSGRQRNANALRRLSITERRREPVLRPDKAQIKFDAHQKALEALWEIWLRLGREPDKDETPNLIELVESFGSLHRALRFIADRKDGQLLKEARASRIGQTEALSSPRDRPPARHKILLRRLHNCSAVREEDAVHDRGDRRTLGRLQRSRRERTRLVGGR